MSFTRPPVRIDMVLAGKFAGDKHNILAKIPHVNGHAGKFAGEAIAIFARQSYCSVTRTRAICPPLLLVRSDSGTNPDYSNDQ